jgi:hypothetical protein
MHRPATAESRTIRATLSARRRLTKYSTERNVERVNRTAHVAPATDGYDNHNVGCFCSAMQLTRHPSTPRAAAGCLPTRQPEHMQPKAVALRPDAYGSSELGPSNATSAARHRLHEARRLHLDVRAPCLGHGMERQSLASMAEAPQAGSPGLWLHQSFGNDRPRRARD